MPDRPNPIDSLIAAARLFAANLIVLLPVMAVLEAAKAIVLLALMRQFGDVRGSDLGFLTSSVALVAVDVAAAWFVVDHHYGDAPRNAEELLRRIARRLPALAAIAIGGGIAIGLVSAPLGLGVATQYAAFPLIAALVVWLDARHTKGDPAQAPLVALEQAFTLTRPVALPAAGLFLFQLFSLYLVPALADSAVGRHAPLGRWSPTESAISALVTPIVAMAIALFYLRLRHAEPQPAPYVPEVPWPQIPGAPPTN